MCKIKSRMDVYMKRNNTFIFFIMWVLLVITVLIISGSREKEKDTNNKSPKQTAAPVSVQTPPQDEKTVGIWIPYMALQTEEGTQEAFKNNYTKMVKDAKSFGINTLFVHVRPFSDALYKSEIYPWSHIITGTQGKDPGFDPLNFMIETTHENGMKFHAWINPLRVRTTQTPEVMSDDNPYVAMSEDNPYYFLNVEGSIYLNPAFREVRTLIADGAAEIAKNYNVDGIQFDDYFYPENIGEEDAEAYSSYCQSTDNPASIDKWRVANINSMVSQVYRQIKGAKKDVVFGISPQGNIDNNIDLGADVTSWCGTKGYIDYICPQLYFSYDNPALGFKESLDGWKELPMYDGLDMFIGLGLYKAGTEEDSGTWKGKEDIIASQVKDLSEEAVDGLIFFDIRSLTDEKAKAEVDNAKEALESY